jgi:hypothetical protein
MRRNSSHDVQTITQVIALALRVDGAPTKLALSRLFLVAPPPLDRANLGWVCSTASRFFAAAFNQLRAPNSVALQLKAQLEELDSACLAEYAKRGASDIPGALEHRQLATPAWASLSKGRLIEDTSDRNCGHRH